MIHKSEIDRILHKSFIDGRDREKIREHIEKLERALSDRDDAFNAVAAERDAAWRKGVDAAAAIADKLNAYEVEDAIRALLDKP